jgi:hypothetical protein
MSATMTAPTGTFTALDNIEAVAADAYAGIKQYTHNTRKLMQMLGGITSAPATPVATNAAAPVTPTAPVTESNGIPDASAIIANAKKKPARKPAAKKAATAPSGDASGTEETETTGQPSLRSVCFNVLTRPENLESGLKAGGDGPSVLKTIVDEKLWVSKKNGNMPALISQCLNTLKKDGKVTRNADTHCFIAKPGITLD